MSKYSIFQQPLLTGIVRQFMSRIYLSLDMFHSRYCDVEPLIMIILVSLLLLLLLYDDSFR